MTNLMEKTWSLYEAERAQGNAEAAELIGDVFTTLDILDMGMDAEANRDYMEKVYYGFCALGVQGGLLEIRLGLENELVAAGILEADEEPEEDEEDEEEANEADHWEDYLLDLKIDQAMEARMMYER